VQGDGAGCGVVSRLLHAKNGLLELFKPEASDCGCGLGHEAASLPLLRDPEAAIDVALQLEAYRTDDLCFGVVFEAEHPVPLVSTLDGGEGGVAVEDVYAVLGKRPWDAGVELFDDLPLREEWLHLGCVG